MKSDIDISQAAKLEPIVDMCKRYGFQEEHIDQYGRHKAKLSLDCMKNREPEGKYIVVTAITPTPLGEGKTVTTVGLSQALNKIGKTAACAIRQPSMGPTFGIKGGAAGGGYSQVIPMEEFNLHMTGDIHAVSIAHNLMAAFVDNSIHHGNPLDLEPHSVLTRRVVDISDRALRNTVVALGGKIHGYPRETGFDIAVASEVMAILALASDLQDLRERLGKIIIGANRDGKSITTEDLKVAGAMAALMTESIKPNIMQTLEGTPAIIHAGPFANIAHGNSSIIADRVGLRYFDYTVTEAGFGADIGAEKFFNIKCRASGLKPDAAVLVCTIRGLKAHSGKFKIIPGKPLPEDMLTEDLDAIQAGLTNLEKQIENVKKHGVSVVVVVNRFPADTDNEVQAVIDAAKSYGVNDAVQHTMHPEGGEGGRDLAEAVVKAAESPSEFKFLYPDEMSLKDKINTIVQEIYGGTSAGIYPKAKKQIAQYEEWGYGHLPICMAKTHLSLSHDPKLPGRPTDFRVPVDEVRLSAGAGFVYPICGKMMTMPGLPTHPAGEKVDIDKDGKIIGLF